MSTLMLLQAATHSHAFAGLACAAQSIAIGIGGPLVGALADRYGDRSVGIATATADLCSWAALLAAGQEARDGMGAAAVLVGLTHPQVGPLVRVHWSRLVRSRHQPQLLPTARHQGPGLPRRPLAVMFLAMVAMGAIFGALQTAVTVYAGTIGRPGIPGLVYAEYGRRTGRAGKPRGGSRRRRTPHGGSHRRVLRAAAALSAVPADGGRNVWIIGLVPRAPR